MATIRVTHDIDDLENDLTHIARTARSDMAGVVRKNVKEGHRLAQRFARAASGPHGRLYYKRITSEMTSPLSGEFGPTGKVAGNAVGAGWRHGSGNTDLLRAADVVGPALADDVQDLAGRWFWRR